MANGDPREQAREAAADAKDAAEQLDHAADRLEKIAREIDHDPALHESTGATCRE